MATKAFGDSITAGTGASVPAKSYVSLLAGLLGETVTNLGVSSYMVFDAYDAVMSNPSALGDKSTIFLGTNDERKYNTDPVKRGYFIDGLRAMAVRLGAVFAPATPANGVTFNAPWSTAGLAWGTYGAWASSAIASFSFSGPVMVLGTLLQNANPATFRVKIDGVDRGTFAIGGDGTTLLGRAYGPRALMFSSLGAGSHTAEIDVLTNLTNQDVYFQWYSTLVPKARVCIVNIPHATSYASGGSSANVDAYNTDIAALVASLAATGLDVVLADVCSLLTPADMWDDVHPNDSGHAKIASAINSALTGAPPQHTFAVAQTYLRDDGRYFIGEGTARKEIATV